MFKSLLIALTASFVLSTASAAVDVDIRVVFSQREATIVLEYYRDHAGSSRRGKGGRNKSLPPGITKNLRRGKSIPPGIAKQNLPVGLIDLLPPAPRGFERIEVAGKVLLVEIATQIIHDVLEDIVFK